MKQSPGIFDKPERTQGQATEEKENGLDKLRWDGQRAHLSPNWSMPASVTSNVNERSTSVKRQRFLPRKKEPTVLPIETEKVSETPSSRRKD